MSNAEGINAAMFTFLREQVHKVRVPVFDVLLFWASGWECFLLSGPPRRLMRTSSVHLSVKWRPAIQLIDCPLTTNQILTRWQHSRAKWSSGRQVWLNMNCACKTALWAYSGSCWCFPREGVSILLGKSNSWTISTNILEARL